MISRLPFVKGLSPALIEKITRCDPRQTGHYSVMLHEVLVALAPREGGRYLDGTFGAGGYSRSLAQTVTCKVFGIDRDPMALACAKDYPEVKNNAIHLLEGCFGDMEQILKAIGETASLDGVALDLGVSSMQLDQAERGFSFQEDGPLDMRMGSSENQSRSRLIPPNAVPPNAADVVNSYDEGDLADIIYRYGEEKKSRQVARAIVQRREEKAFSRTGDLANVIRRVVKSSPEGKAIDPATRTFQALRIHVNDELGELERGLKAAERLLAPKGRLVVVTFHSLEDRIVKQHFRRSSGDVSQGSRHGPDLGLFEITPVLRQISRKAFTASARECADNRRSRSAKLRVAERIASPSNPSVGVARFA